MLNKWAIKLRLPELFFKNIPIPRVIVRVIQENSQNNISFSLKQN